MKVFDAAALRNVAFVGHSGAGKTQLISSLLFDAGAVNRLGHVDDGTAVTDYDEEAIARHHTFSAAPAFLEWNGCKINIIDTPGSGAFLSEARAALRVADAAIVVIDAVSGVQVSAEKAWEIAEREQLPRLIVCNRLDRERAGFDRTLASIRESFGRGCQPLHLPVGDEKEFRGIIDLRTMQAFMFANDGSGRMTPSDVPGDLREAAESARSSLIELVAEGDDKLMERYFESGTLTDDELATGLRQAIAGARICPVLCASALSNVGAQLLADAIVDYVPSPAERDFRGITPEATETKLAADTNGPLVLYVWKTVANQFAGHITMFRVISGILKADSTVHNISRNAPERFGHLLVLEGKTQLQVPELHAGDMGAVAKLKDTHIGDTLGDKAAAFVVPPIDFPEPVLAYAITPKSRSDEDKIGPAIQRLREEDPSIGFARDSQTHDLLLSGQGQMHIEVTVAKLRRRFGVEVSLKPPHVPYRETITMPTEAHGRHKKQTGGHGQFGDCRIRIEPLPRGADFEFVDEIFGGAIPRQFVPAVEKGIQEARTRGYLAGYPMVDFRVTVFDGSYHDVDSNELSFKMAGRLAFKDAMTRARPTLLEPIMSVEVHVPSECAGDVMGDLNGRRGRISGMDTRGHTTIIRAAVPMAEMLTYEQTLTSATGGRGEYHMELSHYDEVPGHLQAKVIAASKAERGELKEEES